MGFGTLFIGYFLLLNIAYYAFTDLISALIMLLAAYRLSAVSKPFKKASILLIPFAALGLFELIEKIIIMFSPSFSNEIFTGIVGIIRYALIVCISYFILMGIEKLAEEVDLPQLKEKARKTKIASLISFSFCMVLEIPGLDKIITTQAVAIIAFIALLISFITTIVALTVIYSAYMRICMPEDLEVKEKSSKFGFVNKFREYEAKKQQEYADYKIDSLKKKSQKGKRGKK